jgi:hypothetical protein
MSALDWTERLSRRLDRTAFPRVSSPDDEASKLALVRVATGLVLVWRTAMIARDARHFFDPVLIAGQLWPLHAIAAGAQLVLAVGLAAGVAPRVCAAMLLFTHAPFAAWTGTFNLGPTLLIPLLGGLALLDTGRMAFWAKRSAPLPASVYRAVYLILFLVYAGLHFQAVLYHLRDGYWFEGRTFAVLLTSSYLSVFYEFFRSVEGWSPAAFWCVSALVVVCQTLFQVAMIPLMAWRWGAWFVRVWGWAFIAGSLVDLRISILPVVEVFYWVALFVPAGALIPAAWRVPAAPAGAGYFRRKFLAVFVGAYAMLLLLFFTNAGLEMTGSRRLPGWVAHPVLYYTGLDAPDVFNKDDLSMGDRWAVIERLQDGRYTLIPFNGPDGERLGYHRSDLVYFRNSLRWRRDMIGITDLVAYHQPGGGGYGYAREIARFDHRRIGAREPLTYRVTMYRNHASQHGQGLDPRRYAPRQFTQFNLVVSGVAP